MLDIAPELPTKGVVFLTERELFDRFLRDIKAAGSQAAWAAKHDLSPGYVNDVVNGRRDMPASVAAALGFHRRPVYLPLRKALEQEISDASCA